MITDIFITSPKGLALCRSCDKNDLKGTECVLVVTKQPGGFGRWYMHKECFQKFINELSEMDMDSEGLKWTIGK